jgi:uncharacterized membrane protein YkvA (DUF1232 family)
MNGWVAKSRALIQRFRQELAIYQRVMADPRTPRRAKLLLGLAIAHLLSPIDTIPDWIPILGQLDDIIIVPLLILLARRFIPPIVLIECRDYVMNAHTSIT